MGSTRPRRVISPVIATSWRTLMPVRSETSAVNIVTPALGPSFGIAPAGMWMWRSLFSRKSFAMPKRAALRADEAERRLGATPSSRRRAGR